MLDLICMGEPMLEFARLPERADGAAHYVEGHGGDTSNAAIAAARQGARVGYVTAIGADMAGDSFMALWAREGVDTRGVRRDAAAQTGVYFITHDGPGGAHRFHHYRRGSAASRYAAEDLPVEMIRAARCFYASGISQGISARATDAVFAAMEAARGAGAWVAYDTNYRPRLWPPARAAAVMHAAIAQCDIALPGAEDVAALTGMTEPRAILDFYQRLGPRIVVLKLGAAGAWLAAGEERWRIPPYPVRAVDAAGAGDVFAGAFLARLLAGEAALAAARHAAVAAALACTGLGCVTPIPRRETVAAALAAWAQEPTAG